MRSLVGNESELSTVRVPRCHGRGPSVLRRPANHLGVWPTSLHSPEASAAAGGHARSIFGALTPSRWRSGSFCSGRHGKGLFFASRLPCATFGQPPKRFSPSRRWRACIRFWSVPAPLAGLRVSTCRLHPRLPASFFPSPTRLTVPSSGRPFGPPLKSNVRQPHFSTGE